MIIRKNTKEMTVSPHLIATDLLTRKNLIAKQKYHHWDDLFPWGWQIKGYRQKFRCRFLRCLAMALVLDIWPGEPHISVANKFNDGYIIVLDNKYKEFAITMARQIEHEFGNKITVSS